MPGWEVIGVEERRAVLLRHAIERGLLEQRGADDHAEDGDEGRPPPRPPCGLCHWGQSPFKRVAM